MKQILLQLQSKLYDPQSREFICFCWGTKILNPKIVFDQSIIGCSDLQFYQTNRDVIEVIFLNWKSIRFKLFR